MNASALDPGIAGAVSERTPWSLQARLLVGILGALILVGLVTTAVVWKQTRHELDELLDGHLAQAAALLVVHQAQAKGDDDAVAEAPELHRYGPRVAFQVFHDGVLTLRSANAPRTAWTAQNGFATVGSDHALMWRVFATQGAQPDVRVLVAEQIGARRSILRAVTSGMLLPLALALPVLAVALVVAVRQGLRPLNRLSTDIGQRRADDLQPLAETGLALEIRPLVQALNGLLERIDVLLHNERRFTADAAHELRTPIAAIRMQAQVAMGADAQSPDRMQALSQVLAGCDRATHLVEQLLTLARLEQASASAGHAPVDAVAHTRSVLAALAPAALARGQTLTLDGADTVALAVAPTLLEVLVRNLVDNALRYSPAGAQIQVHWRQDGASSACLEVHDSGPGLKEADAARLGERFFRVLGTGASGSGLGWSIVRRIAQVQGATVHAQRSAALGGLQVSVCWPLAA